MNTLKELIDDSHNRSRRKGWWNDCGFGGMHPEGVPRPLDPAKVRAVVPEKIALIHSELSECLECYRDGEMEMHFPQCSCATGVCLKGHGKPEGFPSELADVVIRCADLMGAMNFQKGCIEEQEGTDNRPIPLAIAELHAVASDALGSWQENHDELCCYAINVVIDDCFYLAKSLGIDLWGAIGTKAAYNETRSYRHGGKRA